MKKLSLLVFLGALLCLNSCEDDIIGESDTREIVQEPTTTVSTSVSGIITDNSNRPLDGVEVIYNNRTYQSDENGYFKISNVIAGEDGGILIFNKLDYFDNYKFFFPAADRQAFMRVQMIERNKTGELDGSSSGTIDLSGGAKIHFPEAAFVDKNNVSYEGTVSVYAHWFDPSSSSFTSSMPGDLRAIDAESQLVQLSSFGMMAVELEASNGSELQLAQGKLARLEFPLNSELQTNAPAIIETWSLNEENLYWEEEATATLQDDRYIAEVSHFSFWNCDAPFPLVNVYGKVVDSDGNPVTQLRICIIAFNGATTGYGWTDDQGGFRGKVPKNQDLVMQFKDECGQLVFEKNVGPFNTDASFGEIVLDINNKTLVQGKLTCNGMGISDGYARILLDNGLHYIAETDEDGNFQSTIIHCETGNLTIKGFDLANNKVSDEVIIASSQGFVDIGNLEVCEELDEFIIYKIQDTPEFLIEDPAARIIDGHLFVESFIDSLESGISIKVNNVVLGQNEVSELSALLYNSAGNNFFRFDCGFGSLSCEDVELEITELGLEGEYVAGEFMGEGLTPNGIFATIMGRFRIRIDEIGESLKISGLAWLDSNEDGIRQGTESLLPNIIMTLQGGPNIASRTAITNEDGEYSFVQLLPGPYTLRTQTPSGYSLTQIDQGSDDSVDSDISQQGKSLILENQNLENIDVGFVSNGVLACDLEILSYPSCTEPEGGSVVIYISGAAPYQIELNGQSYNTDDSNFRITELLAGDYLLEVTDNLGNSCEKEFELFSFDSLFCRVVTEPTGCDGDSGFAYVDIDFSSSGFTYLWSNGATSPEVDNLSEGPISVTVTGSNGCEAICEGYVGSSEEFLETFIDADQSCINGFPETFLFAEVFGGTEPYEFIWSTGGTNQEETVGVANITVTLSVIDATGCFIETSYFIENPPSFLGDRVWLDLANGTPDVFDNGIDQGVPGVSVELYELNTPANPIDSTITNSLGFYNFEILGPGDYYVKFNLPAGMQFVNQNVGADESIDSDVDPANGISDTVNFDSECKEYYELDAGIKEN